MNKVRIYLKGMVYPLELEGMGMDEIGHWDIEVSFKDNYVWVKRKWLHAEQALYTIPKNNLHYIDWGNWEDESVQNLAGSHNK